MRKNKKKKKQDFVKQYAHIFSSKIIYVCSKVYDDLIFMPLIYSARVSVSCVFGLFFQRAPFLAPTLPLSLDPILK